MKYRIIKHQEREGEDAHIRDYYTVERYVPDTFWLGLRNKWVWKPVGRTFMVAGEYPLFEASKFKTVEEAERVVSNLKKPCVEREVVKDFSHN